MKKNKKTIHYFSVYDESKAYNHTKKVHCYYYYNKVVRKKKRNNKLYYRVINFIITEYFIKG